MIVKDGSGGGKEWKRWKNERKKMRDSAKERKKLGSMSQHIFTSFFIHDILSAAGIYLTGKKLGDDDGISN